MSGLVCLCLIHITRAVTGTTHTLSFVTDGYSTKNLNFEWNKPPFIKSKDMRLPQFEIGDMITDRCDKQYIGGKKK